MFVAEDINTLKVARVKCLGNFLFFERYMFKALTNKRYQQWEHLLIIADALQRVARGEITRLIINVAPRYGKTEAAVKMFIAWGLAINAAAKFIHLSYSDRLAEDNSETVKDLVESEEYKALFPEVNIKTTSKAKKKWYTTAGGGVYAASTGGQITGFGAGQVDDEEEYLDFEETLNERLSNDEEAQILDEFIEAMSNPVNMRSWMKGAEKFAGAIIIDDANKPDDAESELRLTRVNERYDSTISNRVNSRNTPIVLLQQRTHENDLSGYLIRKQGKIGELNAEGKPGIWHVISLPSIKEDGTALCPAKHSIDELLALQAHNDIVFQRQHMQDPKPRAGLAFPLQDLQFYDPNDKSIDLDNKDFGYICCDPAGGNGGDDFAALDTRLLGTKIYVPGVIFNNKDADWNEDHLEKMIRDVKANSVGFEGVLAWRANARRVKASLEKKNFGGEYRILSPRTQKHVRIMAACSFIVKNFVFRKDYAEHPEYAKFMRLLTSYLRIQEAGRGNKTDDAPDVCEMAAKFYQAHFPQLWAME